MSGDLDPLGGRVGQGHGRGGRLQEPGEPAVRGDRARRSWRFLTRPIEGDGRISWIDATDVKVRQAGRIVSVAVIVAVGASATAAARCWAWTSAPSRPRPSGPSSCAASPSGGVRGRQAGDLPATRRGPEAAARPGAERHLAALPGPLHAQRAGLCRQERPPRRLGLPRPPPRFAGGCCLRRRRGGARSPISSRPSCRKRATPWMRRDGVLACMGSPGTAGPKTIPPTRWSG